MNLVRRVFVALLAFVGLSNQVRSQGASPGSELRQLFLKTTPAKAGESASAELSSVYGVALDWPIGEHIATVVSLSDGSASLYTTSTFGIIGGSTHEAVRAAAKRFVLLADRYVSDSAPTSAYPYPSRAKVRFYLLTHEGVRFIEEEAEPIYSGSAKLSPLFGAAQDVFTQLRAVTEKE
jgi:hypothetical protein